MELKVMITSPDGNVSNSSHRKTQSKRDFAYLEKEKITSVSSWESLKAILSDPVTGALMNDATILPCGHSFGAGGLKQVKRMFRRNLSSHRVNGKRYIISSCKTATPFIFMTSLMIQMFFFVYFASVIAGDQALNTGHADLLLYLFFFF
ncbi:hypothetical protein EUTSA_v10003285mg [Eutrema salsugineum]|uniref:U-box domain-containing protein n=1 Tax=Eutrema salsugineum TaxID=72664 RepID=V4NFB9_EUTSA|nr:hypothetical protein EUTSA_v10003285mg [Eutrema salsugineum]